MAGCVVALDTSVFWVVCVGLVATGGFGVWWVCLVLWGAVPLFFVLLVLRLVVGAAIAVGYWLGLVFNAVHVNLVICVLGLVQLWLAGLGCAGLCVVLA